MSCCGFFRSLFRWCLTLVGLERTQTLSTQSWKSISELSFSRSLYCFKIILFWRFLLLKLETVRSQRHWNDDLTSLTAVVVRKVFFGFARFEFKRAGFIQHSQFTVRPRLTFGLTLCSPLTELTKPSKNSAQSLVREFKRRLVSYI